MYKLAVIVVYRYSCDLMGLTVQDYINKPKSIKPVRGSMGFVKRHVKRHANRRRTCFYTTRDHLADVFTIINGINTS